MLITQQPNNEKILLHENTIYFSEQKKNFSQFIKEKRKLLKKSSGKDTISTRELASRLDINYELFRKIINLNKPTKKRDCIIAICTVLLLDPDETNDALILYDYMPTLDPNNPRDDFLIEILEEQLFHQLTISEINQRLSRNQFPELDIIDHRKTKNVASNQKDTPFKLLKKQVRTFSNDLIFGDSYDSIATQYSPNKYRCVADMWLEDTTNKKGYKLTSGTFGDYDLNKYYKDSIDMQSYRTLDETGIFKDYFLELDAMAKRELRSMHTVLNDTKNYQERIGAGIFNDFLHVYVETYNYIVPELNEYYLFELISGEYRLSVYNTSEYMRCYLDSKEYSKFFGVNSNSPIAIYSSVEEIEKASDCDNTYLINYRIRMFEKLQSKVTKLVTDLRERKVYIQRLEYIFDDRDRVCSYYGVDKEFQCTLDSQYVDLMTAGINQVDFDLPDESTVTITLKDLYRAFELKFNNIDEVCRIKSRLGSIEAILL